jgi:hypothetical protein
MELRARTRPILRRAAMMAALPALLVPAVAGTTVASGAERAPVVKRITPKNVFVGQTLTIHGRYFRRGLNKNTVAFKRRGAKVVFVKADKGTAKLLKVKLPKRLENVLVIRNGTPIPTRLQIRVLSTKFGKRYTSKRISPIVGAELPPAPPKPPVADPDADCDGDGDRNAIDTDDDNDLLTDTREIGLGLDPCHVDSDRDGVEDGYEYRSALDLNDDEHQNPNTFLPYPGRRPFPNALFADAGVDYDGDSLTLVEEYRLWTTYGTPARGLDALSYSDGEQYSVFSRGANGRRVPNLYAAGYAKEADFLSWASVSGYLNVALRAVYGEAGGTFDIRDTNRDGAVSGPEASLYDRDGDGLLSDDERDEDADGLSNYDEAHGRMLPGYWTSCYEAEAPFHIDYGATDLIDPDTDGDGVRDGADDQDHDDIPNAMELSRMDAARGFRGGDWDPRKGLCVLAEGKDADSAPADPGYARVNPFNPCLPDRDARTCPVVKGSWAPNDGSADFWILQ